MPEAQTSSATTATILVVADSPAARLRSALALQQAGYRVVEAATQVEAIRFYRTASPEAVVLDGSTLPQNGLPTLRAIVDGDPAARVLLLVAHATQETVWDAVRTGARDVLMAPYAPTQLLQKIGVLVAPPTERQHVRVPVSLKASLGFAATPGTYHVGAIEELSAGGVRCNLAASLPAAAPEAGAIAQLKLVLPDGKGLVIMAARVVRTIAPGMLALAFVGPSEAHVARIEAYCQRTLAENPALAGASPENRTALSAASGADSSRPVLPVG